MALIYTEADYYGNYDTEYHRYSFFTDRGIEFNNRWNGFKNNKVLIAGCGWGYLVEILMRDHGFTDVWGVDASEYAVNVAAPRELEPQYASRILLGDIRSDTSMRSVANAAGITGGNPRFRAILTEDVLPCLAPAEITQSLTVLRARSQAMAHIISPRRSDAYQVPDFTWRTHQEWITTIGPGEPILFTDVNEVSNI